MAILGALWLVLGTVAIIICIIQSCLKVLKWKYTGIISLLLVLGFFLIVLGIGDRDTKSTESKVRIAKLVYNKDDKVNGDIGFDTDGNGKCVIKVKGLADGTVVVKNDDDDYSFKDQIVKVEKGKVTKAVIKQPEKQDVHDYVLDEGAGHHQKFSIFGNNDLSLDDSSSSINSDISDRLDEEKDNGADWAKYVENATYSKRHIKITLNDNYQALNDSTMNHVARMSQGMVLAVLNEDDKISDSQASDGLPTQWIYDGDIVGYTGIQNYHEYHWNN